jgi:hypothetical protein
MENTKDKKTEVEETAVFKVSEAWSFVRFYDMMV